ncbi:hypothetical protein LZQ00_02715 [Sphingobacterium sp. SRCM116780]|uniref:hypothetical protein n=1 Tax=Sphingobacterium sp. SRCM116780 TaxID=2907623 RepID=UPI001F2869A1|nr:hypothetical protein [Sphingobacterium sp. SRCM116780]UIR56737.1 hypothetical protein LZQ00_02715 [Sphingobacterium sp. SRCM116780]
MNTAMMKSESMHVEDDEKFGSFNGPDDDSDDILEDDFNLDDIDSIGEFDDFDDEDEF